MLDNKAMSDKEIAKIKQSSANEQEQSFIEPFDEEEFTKLDNKIKESSATLEEEQEFSKLVPQMAQLQVKDYHRTPEEEKKLL